MPSWLEKLRGLFKKKDSREMETPEIKEESGGRGLNEEMVSSSVDLEPKENDGLAKIFEETEKEEPKEAGEAEEPKEEAVEENKENKQE